MCARALAPASELLNISSLYRRQQGLRGAAKPRRYTLAKREPACVLEVDSVDHNAFGDLRDERHRPLPARDFGPSAAGIAVPKNPDHPRGQTPREELHTGRNQRLRRRGAQNPRGIGADRRVGEADHVGTTAPEICESPRYTANY